MNELAQQLSKILGISFDSAVKLYPELRTQMVYFQIFSKLDSILFFAITSFSVVCIVFLIFIFFEILDADITMISCMDDNDKFIVKKFFKLLIIGTIVLVVFNLVISISTYFLAPDIIMLKSFL